MRGLLALSVSVELFGESADPVGGVLAEGFRFAVAAIGVIPSNADRTAELVGGAEVRERERLEAARLVVARIVTDA